jgi:signal transduction histidine kinase
LVFNYNDKIKFREIAQLPPKRGFCKHSEKRTLKNNKVGMKTFKLIIVISLINIAFGLGQKPRAIDLSTIADSCMKLVRSGQLNKADSLCNIIIAQADNLKNTAERGKVYRIAGNVAVQKNNFVMASDFYKKALTVSEKLNGKEKNELKALTIYNQSLMFFQHGDYQSTLAMCLEARELFYKLNDLSSLAEVDNRIGGVYQVLKQPGKAAEYNKLAYDEAIKSGDKEIICSVLIAYANWTMNNGDTLNAIKYFADAYEQGKVINMPHIMSTAAYNISYCYLNKGDYNQSLVYAREALKCAKMSKLKYDECDALYRIGLAYYYQEKFKPARDTLLLSLEMAKAMDSKPLQRMAYDVLNYLEAESGNYKKAFEYLGYYTDLSASIMSDDDQHQINFLEAKYENARKESEISKLKFKTRLWFSFIVILFLVLIISYLYYKNRQRIAKILSEVQQKEIIRLQHENQLIATQAVQQGEISERIRLSRDLHDGLGGLLSATKLKIANMRGNLTIPEYYVPTFNSALEMLDNSIKELRSVAHNLMPESLMKYGLKSAIADFCNSIETVSFYFYGNDRRLDDRMEVAIYRIVYELVNNALKHANAQQINVQLIIEENRINILVQDNGKGFDTKLIENNNNGGIKNIQNRVASFNGILNLSSTPGSGTEISVEFNV